ncbi:hypothetical protein AB0N31_33560 [Streptomyces sp. NPDC051051]|uniref:hypothetical protein n=1 Tax=Streptomyces sp. NPDC051051 TaxID=3155666 RepID=UPI00341B55E3
MAAYKGRWPLGCGFERFWKRWAGHEGGVADMCPVAWPAGIEARAEVRRQYVHAVDLVPTLYDLLGVEPPEVIKGYPQNPIEGESFRASLTDPGAPGRQTQFYAMPGQRSIHHEGRLACTVHPPLSGWGDFALDVWELYDTDRARSTDLAAREPARLETLKSLRYYNAGVHDGLPLDDRTVLEQVLAERPHGTPERDSHVYYPDSAPVPEQSGVVTSGRSYTVAAGIDVGSVDAEGVLYAHGGVAGGHSLYAKDHRLHYAYNWVGTHLQVVDADREIPPGTHVFTAEFAANGRSADPEMPGAEGTLTLYVDDQEVGSDDIVTQPGSFCVVGDGICVGRDDASPVTPDHQGPFPFTGGTIDKVVVDVSGERYVDHEAQVSGWFIVD